jgi:hypothetical protein
MGWWNIEKETDLVAGDGPLNTLGATLSEIDEDASELHTATRAVWLREQLDTAYELFQQQRTIADNEYEQRLLNSLYVIEKQYELDWGRPPRPEEWQHVFGMSMAVYVNAESGTDDGDGVFDEQLADDIETVLWLARDELEHIRRDAEDGDKDAVSDLCDSEAALSRVESWLGTIQQHKE